MIQRQFNLRITSDSRRAITPGTMTTNAKGVRHQKGLPYFNVKEYPEIVRIYGEKPVALLVTFPTDNYEDFAVSEYRKFVRPDENAKGECAVHCDGTVCKIALPVSLCGVRYNPGVIMPCKCAQDTEKKQPQKERCVLHTTLDLFVCDPKTGTLIMPRPVKFRTHSENNTDTWLSEIANAQVLTEGKLRGLYAKLQVEWRTTANVVAEGKTEKRNYPRVTLQVLGDIDLMRQLTARAALPILADKSSQDIAALQALNGGRTLLDNSRQLTAGYAGEDELFDEPKPEILPLRYKQRQAPSAAAVNSLPDLKAKMNAIYTALKEKGLEDLVYSTCTLTLNKPLNKMETVEDFVALIQALQASLKVHAPHLCDAPATADLFGGKP